MNTEPLVSVIVTTYNRADLISETIRSILNQTFKDFELIIVDDGSTDNTEEVVNNHRDNRIQYIKTDNWGGPAGPRNIGIEKSKGKYIAFCDDDDIWLQQKLEKQIKFMGKSGCSFSSTSRLLIDSNGNPVKEKNRNRLTKLFFSNPSYKSLFFSNQICTSSVLIKRDFLGELRFDEDRLMISVEDYGLWLQLLKKNEKAFAKIDDELVLYRIGGDSSDWERQQLRSSYSIVKHILILKDYSLYKRLISVFAYKIFKFLISLFIVKKYKH